jgi:hypothetical protein
MVQRAGAADMSPDWVREAVCPMVGPMNAKSLPEGTTLAQILDDFRPEVAEWSILPSLKKHPFCPRAVAGGLEYQEFPQSPEHDFALWKKKYGVAFAANEDNGVAVSSSGKSTPQKYGSESPSSWWYMCHNSPRWHDFHKDSIIAAATGPGVSLVRQDNIGCPSGVGWDNGGHCKWCLAGFKQRLGERLGAEQLKALGIASLADFDGEKYLRQQLAKHDPAAALENPLLREYTQFILASNVRAWADEVEAAHHIHPGMPICGNQGSGELSPFGTVLLSAVGDLVFLENSRRAYPQAPNTINYKLALAGARHNRPAWIWDFSTEEFMQQVDGSKLFVAECYANGATPYYEINNLGYSPKKGYYVIKMGREAYRAMRTYAQFAEAHRSLLTHAYRAEAQVALIYSVPSTAVKICGGLGRSSFGEPASRQLNHFLGCARSLEKRQIPYNVEIFGDEELWPDQDLAARLGRYQVVLLPNVEAMSAQQAAIVRQFVRGGGRLLVSGDTATRNERFQRLDRPALADVLAGETFGEGRVVRLVDEPLSYLSARTSSESHGASQTLVLNQTEAKALVFGAWSKAKGVSGAPGADYSIYVDAVYNDGSPLYAQTADFRSGTHDWQLAESTLAPQRPLKSLTLHCLFRYRTGSVWFDDVFLKEQGSERNLLRNPGFEESATTEAKGWNSSMVRRGSQPGYQLDASVKHSGRRSAYCSIRPPQQSPAAETAMLASIDRLTEGLAAVVDCSAGPEVFVNPVRKGQQMIVHLVNYNYDDAEDVADPQRNVRVRLKLPGGAARIAGPVMLASPDQQPQDRPAEYRVDRGCVEFTVPELKVWTIAHFTLDRP